jgi:asparagine synthase (glutamine-hydrolysing)
LPASLKLHGLTEKYLLKKLGERYLPQEIWSRRKRPYRAPVHRSFFNQPGLDYARELLSASQLKGSGLFKTAAVSQLVKKVEDGKPLGETDDMALVGIISTQLLHHQFVVEFNLPPPISEADCLKVRYGSGKTNREIHHEVYQGHPCN